MLVSDDDIVIHVLNNIGSEYKDITAAIRARPDPIGFEELYDKLVDHEQFLKQEKSCTNINISIANYTNCSRNGTSYSNGTSLRSHYTHNPTQCDNPRQGFYRKNQQSNFPRRQESGNFYFKSQSGSHGHPHNLKYQFCDQYGHLAKGCHNLQACLSQNHPTTNYSSSSHGSKKGWLVDSCASHHVTYNLNNLSLHSNYHGPDTVTIGNGQGLSITHIGSTILNYTHNSFHLNDVLCVPFIDKNLISASKFYKSNNASIEFFPYFYIVK